jgi:uncharacterized protein (DUF488 family)
MTRPAKPAPSPILTIGHSTRPLEEFVELLKAHGVEHLVDIRTVPRSRHNPQFNGDSLPAALRAAGIGYRHMKELGGLRHPHKDSPNTGWRNASFRGFADYMQTEAFAAAVAALSEEARGRRIAIMCAEAVPWRCHRSLVADALAVKGVPVEHIMGKARRDPHHMTPFAKVMDGRIIYPSDQLTLDEAAAPPDLIRGKAPHRKKL